MKKILQVIKSNFVIIICILIFILMCIFIKSNYGDVVNEIDEKVKLFFLNNMTNETNTSIMKNITLFGDWVIILFTFIIAFTFFRNKITRIILSINLFLIGITSLGLKYFFKRPRPEFSLIEMPKSYSFPSGHTMFAVGFYGLIIYFIWKTNISKFVKYILTYIISLIIVFVGISRMYLGVHYFTDVIGGLIFGILILLLVLGIYLNYDWRWKK